MTSRLILLSILAALGACGPAPAPGKTGEKQPVEAEAAESVQDLFPLTVGNAWTYAVTTNTVSVQTGATIASQPYERTFKVEKVERSAEGAIGTIGAYDEKQARIAGFQLLVNDKGIYQYSSGKEKLVKYEQPIPWAVADSKLGDKIELTTRGPMVGSSEIVTIETSLVDAGQLEADTISQRYLARCFDTTQLYKPTTGNQAISMQRASFAPKVGLVRLLNEFRDDQVRQTTIFQLKTYTLK